MFSFSWIIPLFIIGTIIQHLLHVRTRRQILDSVPQAGGIEDCIVFEKKMKRTDLWPRYRSFKAEIIYTEHGIYIFQYSGYPDFFRLYLRYRCLYYHEDQILPFLKEKFSFIHLVFLINFMKINGRKVTFDFREQMDRWVLNDYEITIERVNSPDAYRSLLLFQRHWVEKLEKDKRDAYHDK